MSIRSRSLSGVSSVVLIAFAAQPSSAGGRPDDSSRSWFGDFSGGWAFPQGHSSDTLEDDWYLSGGATYWPDKWPVGLNINGAYTKLGLTSESVAAINQAIASDPRNRGRIDDGDVESWQLTFNAIWSPGQRDKGVYLTGGLGAYHLTGTIDQQGLVYYPPICDPWYWWWCIPGGVGQGTIIVGKKSSTEVGYNLGVGYSFPAGNGQMFIEAKYHWIDTSTKGIEYLPLTFGYRW